MIDMYEQFAENICSDCINSSEDCWNGGGNCPRACDFDTLEKLCKQAEQLAESIQNDVSNNDYNNMTLEDAYGWD